MARSFLEIIANFRRESRLSGSTSEYSAIDILRFCSSRGAQSLLQSVFCLGGGMQGTTNTFCDGIEHLSSDVTSGVCAVILGYLPANRVSSYGSVSGSFWRKFRSLTRDLLICQSSPRACCGTTSGLWLEKCTDSSCLPFCDIVLLESGRLVLRSGTSSFLL